MLEVLHTVTGWVSGSCLGWGVVQALGLRVGFRRSGFIVPRRLAVQKVCPREYMGPPEAVSIALWGHVSKLVLWYRGMGSRQVNHV